MLNNRYIIISENKKSKGIYLLYNNVNNKYYIGSAENLSTRINNYYYLSRLNDNRYISNSINNYGHNNFSVFILESYNLNENINILEREQFYIDKYKPKLNILNIAGNSLGFKHADLTKKKISMINKGKTITIETRQLLSNLFKGENNPFYGKSHSKEFKEKLSKDRIKENNPMYGKPKSIEFIQNMYKNKFGINNPMYGKPKSPETLKKLNKNIYVYDCNSNELIIKYDSFTIAVNDLKISKNTLRKYALSKKPYKEKIFSYDKLYFKR